VEALQEHTSKDFNLVLSYFKNTDVKVSVTLKSYNFISPDKVAIVRAEVAVRQLKLKIVHYHPFISAPFNFF